MDVYTRINGQLAKFVSSATDPGIAQVEVRQYLAAHPDIKSPDSRVFAVIDGGRTEQVAA